MAGSIQMAHVADAIESVGGDHEGFGYEEAADMAAVMLQRFPVLRDVAARFAAGKATQAELNSAVLDALQGF